MKKYTQEQIDAIAKFDGKKVNLKFITDSIHIHGLDILDVVELALEAYDLV